MLDRLIDLTSLYRHLPQPVMGCRQPALIIEFLVNGQTLVLELTSLHEIPPQQGQFPKMLETHCDPLRIAKVAPEQD